VNSSTTLKMPYRHKRNVFLLLQERHFI